MKPPPAADTRPGSWWECATHGERDAGQVITLGCGRDMATYCDDPDCTERVKLIKSAMRDKCRDYTNPEWAWKTDGARRPGTRGRR